MTTYRALAEADAYHRSRLTAAFLTGSPEGAFPEPPHAGRCVVGGLVLAAVLVAGALAGSAVTGHPHLTCSHLRVHVTT